MNLPKSISINPFNTTVEIRFKSVPADIGEIVKILLPELISSLPNFENTGIPNEYRKPEFQGEYIPEYSFRNDKFKFSFGKNVLTFSNVETYQLWGNYFPFIKDCINLFVSKFGQINVDRIGLRYITVFDNVNSITEIINNPPSLSFSDFTEDFMEHRSFLRKDDMSFLTILMNNVKARKGAIEIFGPIIDIDASTERNISDINELIDLIDKMHLEQKTLFFSLLKSSYIETLNPQY